jgi:rhamnogalacturonyl hydrolase YesR
MKMTFLVLLTFFLSVEAFTQNFAKNSLSAKNAYPSETYKSMTFNGSWCWFSDPRAVYHEGKYKRTYSGWVDNFGDIHIAFYDHETKQIQSKVLFDNLETDDHVNPTILIDENGKLIVFFSMHMKGVQPLFMIKSSEPESIEKWGEVKRVDLNDKALSGTGDMNHTYTNPVMLSAENNRIYLFWRGVDGKPSFSFSDDKGESWSVGKVFFMPDRIYSFRRPYVKIYSDGVDKIHFCLTDGHPRDEKENSIYYMYCKGGSFYKADGTKIRDINNLPVSPGETDLVYNAKAGKARAWNWDLGTDENSRPVIAYAKYPDDSTHIYCYSVWDGKKWNNTDLINSGSWFPETPPGKVEPEPNYSGGMSLDHESPGTLYLSINRDSVFEIEKWVTSNNGKSWKAERLTRGSAKNNVRPFAIRGAKEGNPIQVLWLQNTNYLHFANGTALEKLGGKFETRFHSSVKMNLLLPEIVAPLKQYEIVNIMRRAADWQLANPYYGISRTDWHYGALYTGIRAFYELTGEARYKNELLNVGQSNNWKPMDDIFHADRLTVMDNWAWLYSLDKDPQMIDKSKWALDIHLARNYKDATDVRFIDNPNNMEWWTWCDALFMAPPSFAEMWKVTGNENFLKYMETQWWKTSDYLYSKTDSLYYRDDRFINVKSENGKKIFWSRGNGWVIAGISRILTILPMDDPGREKFEQQYREMAHKLLSLQEADGLWRVSLLDPEYLNIGESSGSAFFTFALAWGINNGLLEDEYRENVQKAWTGLCHNVNRQGRLGYVQQVAGDPYPFYENQWQVYATGAFLLAGSEMYKLMK